MGARTGAQYLEGLADRGREIWVEGERVDDVAAHPKLSGAARSLAAYFDRQNDHADLCLVHDPDLDEPVSVSHMVPRSKEDLFVRHRGLVKLTEGSMGIMGRTPDYMNMKFSAFCAAPWVWAGEDNRNERGAANIVDLRRRLAGDDIALTHTIIQPNNDKRTDAKILDNKVTVRKVGETPDGIIVRGARVLATLAPFADEQAVYPALPLPPGADDYAVSFVIPLDTPGLKFWCRDSFSAPWSQRHDKPISARYDEQDAFCVFDDVLVPWDRVLIDGDVDIYNSIRQTQYAIHMTTQSTIRALTKLEFAYGLATRMAEIIGDHSPATNDMLGEIACYVQTTRNAVELSIEQGWERERDGMWFPNGRCLDPMRALLATWMPRVQEIMTLIGSHNLLTTPSASQFDNPGDRPLIDETLFGANDVAADERSAVFRLAWDFIGSGLAGRGFLYERFYLTSATRNRQTLHLALSDRQRPAALVDEMLALARS
ncbi:MAG: 4-hydroxyphenylacetate 3-hydroxylase N-terminal domain-containing protein [Acidimicrobiales bacterium]